MLARAHSENTSHTVAADGVLANVDGDALIEEIKSVDPDIYVRDLTNNHERRGVPIRPRISGKLYAVSRIDGTGKKNDCRGGCCAQNGQLASREITK